MLKKKRKFKFAKFLLPVALIWEKAVYYCKFCPRGFLLAISHFFKGCQAIQKNFQQGSFGYGKP